MVCASPSAQSCSQLQVLELERITDLSLQAATELCKAGLRGLQTLVLTHTPVSGQAILHFHSETPNPPKNIKWAFWDYFGLFEDYLGCFGV